MYGRARDSVCLIFSVRYDAVLFEIDQQHLARLQAPLGDDRLLRHRQHAHFRRQHDEVVVGDEISGGPEAVAVERRADLAPVGEGDRRRAVPRLHQRGVIFVESAPLLVHQRIAGPGFRDQGHHRVAERIAALNEKFERVVKAGGIRLALVGDRPQLGDIGAEQFGIDARLTRSHPVDVAAQRVDFAVVRDHAIGMRETPRWKRVGREPLMDQGQRGLIARIQEVAVIGRKLPDQHHALVDDGAGGHRDRVIFQDLAAPDGVDAVGDDLAGDEQATLESRLRWQCRQGAR